MSGSIIKNGKENNLKKTSEVVKKVAASPSLIKVIAMTTSRSRRLNFAYDFCSPACIPSKLIRIKMNTGR